MKRRSSQSGMLLIEAMVAVLIFALGILGLVAMGGAAVNAQSDAQYRTEAANLADAIAGEIQLATTRNNAGEVVPTSLGNFSHFEGGGDCLFSGSPATDARVQALADSSPLPGAIVSGTQRTQQILVSTAAASSPAPNRVQITVCWKSNNDTVRRQHVLVTYVN